MIYLAQYGTAWTLRGIKLVSRTTGQYRVTPTIASGDFKIEKDGGTAANLATLPAVEPTGGTSVSLSFSAAEMQCQQAVVTAIDQAGAEWNDDAFHIFTVGDMSSFMRFNLFTPTVALSTPAQDALVTGFWGAQRITHQLAGSFGEKVTGVANGVHLDSEFHRGQLQAATGSTATLATTASATDSLYNDGILVILTGTGAGQARRITSYVGSTRVATLTNLFETTPDATSTYTIFPGTRSNVGFWRGVEVPQLVSSLVPAIVSDSASGQAIADEILNRNLAGGGSGNTRNVRNALRSIRNRVRNNGGTLEVFEENDSTIAWSAALTAAAGNPITEVDP